jgi:3-hydroxyisobutyrate dehydrogenase-like beta-hydroxyacid dehydrogenase
MTSSEMPAETPVRTGATEMIDTVAVLGAGGTMGFPMARNIARARMTVRAWNRSRDKAEPLGADGAYIADTPADAAAGAGIVLTMLADADAVVTAMEGDNGALPVMADSGQPDPPIWLQMSTIGEETTEWCTELAVRYGVAFVDAPVLGTRQPAEQGQLVVHESGPKEARPQVQPVFDAVGHRTMARAITERDFTPSFRLRLAAKDAGLVRDAAWQRGLDLPLFELIADRFGEGTGEHGDKDISATYLTGAPEQAA